MLLNLSIRDLAVIRRAELEFPPGLTAITGETGAGKTVLARALGLLAGAPAERAAVRSGARAAVVEGVLAPPEGFWEAMDDDDPAAELRELVDDEREIVVARRVPASGNSRALIDGQSARREALASLMGALVRFSSQGDARRLTSAPAQLAALDAFAGTEAVAMAGALSRSRRALAGLDRRIAGLRRRRESDERVRGELESVVEDVEEASPDAEELEGLRAERERLRHSDRLAAGVGAARAALGSEEGEGGAETAVGAALAAMEPLVELDPVLRELHDDLSGAQATIGEAILGLGRYLTDFDAQPGRLDAVEERLSVYDRLLRRYGGTIEAVEARVEDARSRLAAAAEGSDEEARLSDERADLLDEARAQARALGAVRREAAPRLAEAVMEELADLAMPEARAEVRVSVDDADPPRDRCDIWLAPNPGLDPAPLGKAASGGELSRVLLALHVQGARERGPSWVFDEVDAGIGGATATAVGARLARLARSSQVVVITHLPQVAALADANYRVEKAVSGGESATEIASVRDEGLVAELCRMLGAGPDDSGARRHAEELLARRAGA